LILLHGEILGTECTHQTTRSRLFFIFGQRGYMVPPVGTVDRVGLEECPGDLVL
jgi:hypothetical protein